MATQDRRPIAARKLSVFRWMAQRLAGLGVTPNTISVLGMIAGVGAGVALALTPHAVEDRLFWAAAAVLVPLRLLANMLDGMVAEFGGKTSRVGAIFNEVPDRVSDSATLIGLGFAMASSPTMGYIASLLAMMTAYIRTVGKASGSPQDFRGPMAKQQRMVLVMLVCFFFALTPHEFRMWSVDVRGTVLTIPTLVLGVISLGCVVTCVRRLTFVCSYLRNPE